MQTFRERFDAMLGELRAHPEVEIFSVEIRPPADPDSSGAVIWGDRNPDAMAPWSVVWTMGGH